jgi:hypothetical protein
MLEHRQERRNSPKDDAPIALDQHRLPSAEARLFAE